MCVAFMQQAAALAAEAYAEYTGKPSVVLVTTVEEPMLLLE